MLQLLQLLHSVIRGQQAENAAILLGPMPVRESKEEGIGEEGILACASADSPILSARTSASAGVAAAETAKARKVRRQWPPRSS